MIIIAYNIRTHNTHLSSARVTLYSITLFNLSIIVLFQVWNLTVMSFLHLTFSSPVHDGDVSCQQILFFKTCNVDIMIIILLYPMHIIIMLNFIILVYVLMNHMIQVCT